VLLLLQVLLLAMGQEIRGSLLLVILLLLLGVLRSRRRRRMDHEHLTSGRMKSGENRWR
jgi:hypothetical protein